MADSHPPVMTFLGGAQTVTGSKTLVDTPVGRVLVDCGLFQGRKQLRLQNWEPFPVPPETIDAVLLTHAHIDHCGYLPRLARLGFAGPVYCTDGTERLAGIVLPDSGHLHEEEAAFANRKGYSKHDPAEPLYTEQDALRVLSQLEAVPYDSPVDVLGDVRATFRPAGHILGAASLKLELTEHDVGVVFSGDLGRPTHPLLRGPEPIGPADVVVTESTYGDEEHLEQDPEAAFASVIGRVADRGGVVVIPAFAVDRTEVVLWHLDRLVAEGRIPSLPTFVDSPMACRALDVYEAEARRGSPELRPEVHRTSLYSHISPIEVLTSDESKELNDRPGPFVIVSASGMATGGRVIHHLVHRIGDARNAIVLVGFQAPGTRGAALRGGASELKMFGQYHPVRAEVASVELSTHADRSELLDWLATASPAPDVLYVNHGEVDASNSLAGAIRSTIGAPAIVPRPGERIRLDRLPSASGRPPR